MSVNRKVTVPLGGAAICLRVLLLHKRHYSTGNAPSEVEGVEVARDLHWPAERGLRLCRELGGVHEVAGAKVREDQPPDPGVASDPARIGGGGVAEGVRLLGDLF